MARDRVAQGRELVWEQGQELKIILYGQVKE